ncbi:MAG: hypothetical protein GEU94_17305 [Micromonosporaceae bacterium]|nr:hypothetical protein [Micromonosporaceae bacterium]
MLLIWQDPVSRQFRRVGQLDHLDDGRYAFRYLDDAHHRGFYPLAEFPDLDAVYVSSELPAFFGNRVMSRQCQSASRTRFPTQRVERATGRTRARRCGCGAS